MGDGRSTSPGTITLEVSCKRSRRSRMCGKYTLSTPVVKPAEKLGLAGPLPELQPSYNVAPAREVPAVVAVVAGKAGWRCLGGV
jgi:hypothetical protein